MSRSAATVARCWPGGPPDWVRALADECDRTSQRAAAARIGYSRVTVNLVLHGAYRGGLDRIEAAVRRVLDCPVPPQPARGRPSPAVRAKEIAASAWGATLPDWVQAIAEACDQRSQREVAVALHYSPAVISQVLRRRYAGRLDRIEARARVVMRREVDCPILANLSGEQCLANQLAELRPANIISCRLFRACRSGCPNATCIEEER